MKRSSYLFIFMVFIALAFLSDFPLWNDGAHFLIRLLEYGYFVDPLWERYLDIIFQIIPKTLQNQNQSIYLIKYFFKLGLALIPAGIICYRIKYLESKNETKSIDFIFYNLITIFSVGIFFPATTSFLSSLLGLLMLSFFIQEKIYQNDFLYFILLQFGLIIGHESSFLAIFTPLFLFKYSIPINQSKKSKNIIFSLTFLSILILAYFRLPYFLKNLTYVEGQKSIFSILDISIILIWIFGIPSLYYSATRSNSTKFTKIFYSSLILIYFLIYQLELANWYRIFYNWRNIFFIFCFINFFIFQKINIRINKKLNLIYLTFIFLLTLKISWYWSKSNNVFKKYADKTGCFYISKNEFGKFSPPQWTYPFLSILNQNTFKPSHIIFSKELTNGQEYCFRAGVTLITPFKMDNYLQFNTSLFSQDLLNSIPLFIWDTEKDFLAKGIVLNQGDNFKIQNNQKSCLKLSATIFGENKKISITKDNKNYFEKIVSHNFEIDIELPEGEFNFSSEISDKYYSLVIKNFELNSNCRH